jgi:hypothetical protein
VAHFPLKRLRDAIQLPVREHPHDNPPNIGLTDNAVAISEPPIQPLGQAPDRESVTVESIQHGNLTLLSAHPPPNVLTCTLICLPLILLGTPPLLVVALEIATDPRVGRPEIKPVSGIREIQEIKQGIPSHLHQMPVFLVGKHSDLHPVLDPDSQSQAPRRVRQGQPISPLAREPTSQPNGNETGFLRKPNANGNPR